MSIDDNSALRELLGDRENLLMVPEVAKVLRVRDTTVRDWLRKNLLPGYRIPGGWRVRVGDLLDFIEEGKSSRYDLGEE